MYKSSGYFIDQGHSFHLMFHPDAGSGSPFENFRRLTESEGEDALTVRSPESAKYESIPGKFQRGTEDDRSRREEIFAGCPSLAPHFLGHARKAVGDRGRAPQ